MGEKLKKEFFGNDAVTLAQNLLGKVICYNNGTKTVKYMITVTEAYPYYDNDSYVNRYHEGSKGHDALVGNKTGNILIYSGMFHVVGSCENEDPYRCDNILIRGGIEIDKDGNLSKGKDKNLFFEKGKPYKLCRTMLGIPDEYCERAENVLKDYKTISNVNIESKIRIGLKNSTDCLRYSIKKEYLEELIGDKI